MALNIINRMAGMRLEKAVEGTLVADGSEQEIIVDEILSKLSGWLDLSELQGGDSVIIRQYLDMHTGYKLYAEETYSNIQAPPMVYITYKTSNNKMKITLQQTTGTYRNFNYEFAREVY